MSAPTNDRRLIEDDDTDDEEDISIGRRRRNSQPRPNKRRSGWGDDDVVNASEPPAAADEPPTSEPPGFSTDVTTTLPEEPSRLHILAQQLGLSAEQIKAARELYVGNLPPQLEVSQLVEFLNAAILALKGNVLPGPPCIRGWRATEGHFAFIEFRTMEEANNGIALNGINCLNYSLRIGRPKTYPDYLSSVAAAQQGTLPATSGVTNGILTGVSLGTSVNKELLGPAFSEASSRLCGTIITSVGAVTPPPDAMCLRNLPPPTVFSEDRAREFLTAFGSLKFFLFFGYPNDDVVEHKVREYEKMRDLTDEAGYFFTKNEDGTLSSTIDESALRLSDRFVEDLLSQPLERSVCFFEFHNPLDSQNLTDESQKLRLAGLRPILCAAESPLAEEPVIRVVVTRLIALKCAESLRQQSPAIPVPTRCLYFANIINPEDLTDDAEYADILDDVKVECRKFGRVISIEIPRPFPGGGPPTNGEGMAFVEFATVEEACRARRALNGRRFAGRITQAEYLSESKYSQRDFKDVQYNTSKNDSTMYNPELATHVPAMLKQMEDLERAGREAARAAATAAANASFTGGVTALELPAIAANMAALIDVPKPSFDEDVDRHQEDMDEEDLDE